MRPTAREWTRALRLMDDALALTPGEREAWLKTLAEPDAALRPLLSELLAQRARLEADEFLEAPAALPEPHEEFRKGQQLGPYRLLRGLGRGGMASVWLAERADGAHRRPVALKLPVVGCGQARFAAGFAQETLILSRLSHPHIASVLDAGHDGPQPWLAMEFVDGQTLTDHCHSQALALPARLALMVQVLRAVQHAHIHLVIHRDLKPSNVMVDRNGQVKLLDFGIAKLLAGDGSEAAVSTLWQGRAMTPHYAAPEQIAGGQVGTAADIYACGALLFELITGRRAHQPKRDTPVALEDSILHDEVPRPSRVAATDPQAGLPGVTGRSLARQLRGDLDVIVRKAMHKLPTERYASADAMAEDIERHLQQRPVLARPDSALYTLRRFAARHRAGVMLSGLALVALVAGSATIAWQGRQAQLAGERAQATMAFLTGLFENTARLGSGVKPAHQVTGKELLEQGATRLLTEHTERNALRLELLELLSRLTSDLDLLDLTETLQDEALTLSAALHGQASRQHAKALLARAETTVRRGDFRTGLAQGEQALAALDRWRDALPESWAQAQLLMGNVLDQLGRESEARRHLEAALERLRSAESRSEDRSRAAYYLARTYEATRDYAAAEPLYLDGLEAAYRNFGPNSYIVAFGEMNYGDLLRLLGRGVEARQKLQHALQTYTALLGPKHLSVAGAWFYLGQALAADGARSEADAAYARAIAISDEVAGPFHPNYGGFFVIYRATLLADMGRWNEARALFESWLKHSPPGSVSRDQNIRWAGLNFSRLLIQQRDLTAAARILDEVDASIATLPPGLPRTELLRQQARARRAQLDMAGGRIAVSRERRDGLLHAMSAPGGDFSGALALLTAFAEAQPGSDDAEQALKAYEQLGDSNRWAARDIEQQARQLHAFAVLHRAAGHTSLGRALAEQLIELRERIDAPDSPGLEQARRLLR